MGGPHTKVRRRSKVETDLPVELREQVDRLLIEGATYEEIAEYVKAQGYDISRSSIGRYGKAFLNAYRRIRIVEDQARALKSEVGDGLVLEEAASKLFTQQVLELLLSAGVDILETPRLLGEFAKLQSSSVAREKLKADLAKRLAQAAEEVEKTVRRAGLSDEAVDEIRRRILGVVE